ISMPYAGKTAEIISKKTGAEVIELGLPFGLDGTKKWLLQVAEKTESIDEANDFIDTEMKAVLPLLEWLVPAFFRLKTFSFVGDPFLCESMCDALSEIDMKPLYNVIFSTKNRLDRINIIRKLPEVNFSSELDEIVVEEIPDFFIGNSEGRGRIYDNGPYHIEPYTEIGFPSYGTHFFYLAPYMGITGFLIFLNRMINSLKPE
ncbi:MAG: nitrogenase component 1, partial [Nanoarchaeota archaeon]